ncbi:leucyl aminopeptidase [Lederbergia galactosidilytica]|uniref:Probable cytosol aminopeptidase n=1 Tax=Lederbergia galactosidilytica TaxID=217031 RepID=A0A177ZIN1_9BACI|nr:leucyl aminopeptidase [Lederbergia galactosidilytica]KRG15213.1 aminopeptidase A [Virgibacillus soli]OAK67821.1 aminopeptidase A [Lederbergia galactosidilytica]
MFTVKHEDPFVSQQECLVIGLWDQPEKFAGKLKALDESLNGQLTDLVKSGDISAKHEVLSLIHTFGKIAVKRLLFVGLGKPKADEDMKTAIGLASKKIQDLRIYSFGIDLDSFTSSKIDVNEAALAFGEAYSLSTYAFKGYKQQSNEPEVEIENINVYAEDPSTEIESYLNVGQIYGEATNSARTLVNTPGNLLTAADLATYARNLAEEVELEVEILEKEEIEKLGMGALLAVNQGSVEPPHMIVLKYQGKQEWEDVIGLVGKGVTFDTGGYSLKPKTGIVGMKTDMGGAAAVLGAMEAIGKVRPKQNVVAVIPATDNMISGNAMKPDDVITSMNGKTIEVLNTDAEGRLVLADAMTYAKQHGANYLIDVATLTGGVIVALGLDKTGALTNHEALFEEVLVASKETGEFIWRLPYTEQDKKRVRSSTIADLNNSPGREGHAIMGGAFIGEFAEGTPWVHLDIAGTATTNKAHSLGPAGATGVMVRTLALLVENHNIENN